ncbi:MAG: hypothetical protein J3K34DRAFT_63831 [Monoraphidium minutum]|nr:MAG: hypothetical protein J3K34DRAFT_63831 [Monoraphidium minutum]
MEAGSHGGHTWRRQGIWRSPERGAARTNQLVRGQCEGWPHAAGARVAGVQAVRCVCVVWAGARARGGRRGVRQRPLVGHRRCFVWEPGPVQASEGAKRKERWFRGWGAQGRWRAAAAAAASLRPARGLASVSPCEAFIVWQWSARLLATLPPGAAKAQGTSSGPAEAIRPRACHQCRHTLDPRVHRCSHTCPGQGGMGCRAAGMQGGRGRMRARRGPGCGRSPNKKRAAENTRQPARKSVPAHARKQYSQSKAFGY